MVWASYKDGSWVRCSEDVPSGGGPGADPGHAGHAPSLHLFVFPILSFRNDFCPAPLLHPVDAKLAA